MLPWSPERQVLQYLAICSVVSMLIYLQGTGVYLRHSFMVFSGLLYLICAFAGTETMLRFLPLVLMSSLLASWVFQVYTKVRRGLQDHGVQNEEVTTPVSTLRTLADKEPEVLVIEGTLLVQ